MSGYNIKDKEKVKVCEIQCYGSDKNSERGTDKMEQQFRTSNSSI